MYILISLFFINLLAYQPAEFQMLSKLVKEPLFSHKFTLNTTLNNNALDIYVLSAMKFDTLAQIKGKQAILIDSYMHAREPYSFQLIKALYLKIIKDYRTLDAFLKKGIFIFYPFVNIDSYRAYQVSSERQKSEMRKNMNSQIKCQQGIAGIDINRNFPAQFATVRESQDPCGQQYHGRQPFSQRQSNVFKILFLTFRIILAIDIHSFGNEWIYPYASDATGKRIKNHSLYSFYEIIIEQLKKNSRKIKSCKESLGYIADGVYIDWALDQNAVSLAYQIGKTFHSDQKQDIQSFIELAIEDFFLIFQKLVAYNYDIKIQSNRITIISKTLLNFNIKVNISSDYYQRTLSSGQKISFNRKQTDEKITIQIVQQGKIQEIILNKRNYMLYTIIVLLVAFFMVLFLAIIKNLSRDKKGKKNQYNQKKFKEISGSIDEDNHRSTFEQISMINKIQMKQ